MGGGVHRWALGGVVVMLLLAGLSAHPLPQAFAGQDKLEHAVGFAVFAFALRLAFPRLHAPAVFAACLGLALAIEFGQALLPLRTASLADVVAGLAGATLGWAASFAVIPAKAGDPASGVADVP